MKSESINSGKAIQWMIDIADALREAHRKGFVHRDVKPQNILIDQDDRVYLVDFGLALADQDVGKRLPAGGTPAYMSPEQARGEGHRVDGRSDLFSLGIMFYEMLCGRRPFQGNSHLELYEQITDLDPKPLRQWIDSVPQELERICLKMLAKRKSDRYSNAKDLVDDLKAFVVSTSLDPLEVSQLPLRGRQEVSQLPLRGRQEVSQLPLRGRQEVSQLPLRGQSMRPQEAIVSDSNLTKKPNSDVTPFAATPTSGSRALKIVPKGLRSFDHRDADFFLELLPGARDRDGLPESVGFWKSRIEERDADQTFAVGLVYGPSGCGKSSMMKAGLLPRLAPDIVPIYLEATVDETERTLLSLIRKKLDSKEADSATSLVDLLHEVRLGRILPRGKKLVMIIDQFEQWLFAHPSVAGEPILEALLQCDGVRVQAIVMVRDDFWMAASRFFRELGIPLLERINSAAVDLFDLDHAERVLTAFGRAFGKLESEGKEEKQDRKTFITEAVSGLAEQGKVISVRLSLFAEMMKGRPWTPESLREVGGTTGVGATFLEETFSASGAPPQHRYHQEAARSVLRAMLPQAGTDIKGHKRSTDELRSACGYGNRQRDFDDLIRILDGELRLITPVDSTEPQALAATSSPLSPRERVRERAGESNDNDEDSNAESRSTLTPSPSPKRRGEQEDFWGVSTQYQLTHDYLVPSLRDWLTRKQRESRRGRAELKLAERAATWSDKRENKQLPTVSEWLSIRTLTDSKKWTESELAVMKRAGRVHGRQWGGLVLFMSLLGCGIQQWISTERWKNLREQTQTSVESLQNNLGPSVPFNLDKLQTLPKELVLPELQTRYASTTSPLQKLSLAFALAKYNQLDANYLISRVDDIAESDQGNYINALKSNVPVALNDIQEDAAKCNDKSLWRRKVRFAIVALNLGDAKLATDVCAIENRPDPEQRTLFIDDFPRWENLHKDIHELVSNSDSPALRSGLCLGVGQIIVDKLSDTDKEFWQGLASRWFVEKGDTTTHSAAGWLLRRWGIAEPKVPDQDKIVSNRDWFINSVGTTMLKIRENSPVAVALADPLVKYRKQLADLSKLAEEELDKPENRMARAVANYQVGNIEPALEDLDWLLTKANSETLANIIMFRTLALARLGKADEAKESLSKFLEQKIPKSYVPYMQIQLPAWLGKYTEATRQLELALGDSSNDAVARYNLACAASLCAKAAIAKNPEQSKQFADQAIETLRELVKGGYKNKNQLYSDPDFENLREDARFTKLLDGRISELWVADREVSRGQFELFMSDATFPEKEKPEKWEGVDKSKSPTAEHPAQRVSWYDSVMYCNWLSLHEGRKPCYERMGTKEMVGDRNEVHDVWRLIPEGTGYRLLSEEEWEYACRAGTQTEFSMGSVETLLVNYCQMYPSKLTAICGAKIPNAWGLHDVHGNVWEWCEDVYDTTGSYRAPRGGGWYGVAGHSRSANRGREVPSIRNDAIGFRVALSPSVK